MTTLNPTDEIKRMEKIILVNFLKNTFCKYRPQTDKLYFMTTKK